MKLKKLLDNAAAIAFETVGEDVIVNVSWYFSNGLSGTYDPLTEKRTEPGVWKDVNIIPYVDKRSDDKSSFSSTGRFIDPPVESDEFEILIRGLEIEPYKPSVNDVFKWFNDSTRTTFTKFNVRGVERVPTDAIFTLRVIRA